jgi:hypothetical protein
MMICKAFTGAATLTLKQGRSGTNVNVLKSGRDLFDKILYKIFFCLLTCQACICLFVIDLTVL